MKYMFEWDAIVFLGTPIMRDVDSMLEIGLYLNDLSMHDSSRDMVLAGEQQSAELKLALEQENEKSKRLEESLRRLDEEMRRTDELLYQMIPRSVAQRLRAGEAAMDTCETFENVTLLLSDVVGFTTICSGLAPLEVVGLLNKLYSVFDGLTEKHKVYKVETIGDAYMIASGCPTRTDYHSPFIAEMALDMVESVQTVKDESKEPPESLRIRVGIHTGPAVAGVVGVKMPRYCLFGSTVTTSELMEQTSSPQRIQVSVKAYENLSKYGVYDLTEKGTVELKVCAF
ncbi:Soluble guanylate cyclase 88E [Schistosoma japonicum]|nr:Soluble guanylate cyclase 88E [Schistosoma japonicum]